MIPWKVLCSLNTVELSVYNIFFLVIPLGGTTPTLPFQRYHSVFEYVELFCSIILWWQLQP